MTRVAKNKRQPKQRLDSLASIYLFKSVIETKNFSETARLLAITPSSVSKRVKSIEDQLQVRLIDRTTRNVRPTEAGLRFFQRCTEIAYLVEETENEVHDNAHGPAGTLRIAAPPGFALARLNSVIYSFVREYPKIEVEVVLNAEMQELVEHGIDLAIRLGGSEPEGAGLVKRIGENRRVYCAAPKYLDIHGTPAMPSQLQKHSCIIGRGKYLTNRWQFHVNGRTEEVQVTGRFVTNNISLVLDAAVQGVGVAMIPRYFTEDQLARGDLVEILAEFNAVHSWVYVIIPQRHHVPFKTRKFLEFMGQHMHSDITGTPSSGISVVPSTARRPARSYS